MRIRVIFISLLVLVGLEMRAAGDISNMQAMYIYNFMRLINWPDASNSQTFVIGVIDDNDAYVQLSQYTSTRKIGIKSIVVKKITSAEEALSCQLVFISAGSSQKIADLKNKIGSKPCLIVSEKEGSNALGSTIEFFVQDNKLKFRINEERAKQQNLAISRTLLDMSI